MFNDPEAQLSFDIADEAGTEALAAKVAGAAAAGDVISLVGDLGLGKTVFARAFIRALCGPHEEVPSPTFTLLQTYGAGRWEIYHFDFYRLSHPDEALEIGVEEAFSGGVSLIEWGERLGPLLPTDYLEVKLQPGLTANGRRITLTGHGYWRAKLGEGISAGAIHA